MSLLTKMIEYRRYAEKAHCRIKRWKLTGEQLDEIVEGAHSPLTQDWQVRQLREALAAGEANLVGAPVEIIR